MRTIDAIVQLLVDGGAGTAGVDVFAGSDVNIPQGAGPYSSVMESAGRPPVGIHNSTALHQPSFQVVVRGEEYEPVGARIDVCAKALGGDKGLTNIDVGGVFFLTVRPSSEPFQLPNDAQGRVRLAFNVSTVRR